MKTIGGMKGSETITVMIAMVIIKVLATRYNVELGIDAETLGYILAVGGGAIMGLMRWRTTTPIFQSEPTPIVIGHTGPGEPIVVRAPQNGPPIIQVEVTGQSPLTPPVMELTTIPGTVVQVDSTAKPGTDILVQTATLQPQGPK